MLLDSQHFENVVASWEMLPGRGLGSAMGQGELAPATAGELAVGGVVGDGFFGAQGSVVEAAEERGLVGADAGDGCGQDPLPPPPLIDDPGPGPARDPHATAASGVSPAGASRASRGPLDRCREPGR